MKITDTVYFYKGRPEQQIARGVGSCNVAVVKTDKQAMFDTGLIVGGAFKDLQNSAEADGLDLSDTMGVLHTHAHWDHIIGDTVVQGKYGAKVYAHPWERKFVESQPEAFRAMFTDIGDFYPEVFGYPPIFYRLLLRYIGGKYKGIRVDETLTGGEELDFGMRVVACHTPGHCPGHMGYYLPDEKVFIGGDLIDLESGTGVDLNNPHSCYADGLESLQKVRSMDIEYYLPSHGDPVKGKDVVMGLLDRMIDATYRYIDEVKGCLEKSEGTLTDVFEGIMPGTPFTLRAMKMMQVLTTLKHLEEKGEVALQKQDGKPIWMLAA